MQQSSRDVSVIEQAPLYCSSSSSVLWLAWALNFSCPTLVRPSFRSKPSAGALSTAPSITSKTLIFSFFFSFLNWNRSSFCTYGAMIYRDQTRFTQLRYLGKISKFPGISEEGLVCLKARVFFSNCFNLSTNMLPLCKNLAQLVMVWLYIKVLSISK